eukprot:15330947-Ditylum_brightwellii.AAC.1
MKAHAKANQKKRLTDDDDFIPCSARIEFQFKVSKEIEADQEFRDLLETMNNFIGDCKQRLKAQIVKCIDIKLKLLHQQLLDNFIRNLWFITKQHLVYMNDKSNINKTVSAFLQAYKEDLSKHLPCNDEDLHSAYKRVHTIPVFPILNANIQDNINALANAELANTQEQALQQSLQQVDNSQQSQDSTPTFAHLYFASQSQETANQTLLNNTSWPTNTYINNRSTPSNNNKYAKQTFHTFYNKLADPLHLAFINTFVYSWSTYIST